MDLATSLPIDPTQYLAQPAPRTSGGGKGMEAARHTAEDFEAFFISSYLDAMFAGLKTDGPFGGGHAEGVYRSLLNQELGKAIARSGGVGVADQVMQEILKLQEGT